MGTDPIDLAVPTCVLAQSVVLTQLVRLLRTRKKHVTVTGATGQVGSALGGGTLHSWAGIGHGDGSQETLLAGVQGSHYARQNWSRVDVLIIDEISLIDGELFQKLSFIAKKMRSADKPFGGIQLVLCGDFLQLPPIKGSFAFETPEWRECVPNSNVVQLTVVHRQRADQKFVRYQYQHTRTAESMCSLCAC